MDVGHQQDVVSNDGYKGYLVGAIVVAPFGGLTEAF